MLEGGATYFSMMGGLPNFRRDKARKRPKRKAKMRRENGSEQERQTLSGAASPRNK